MTDAENIAIGNLLAGCDIPAVAAGLGWQEATVSALLDKVLAVVSECMAVGDTPFFACATLAEARKQRLRVLDILAGLERWDATERPVLQAILRGEPGPDVSARFGLDKPAIGELFARVAPQIAARLTPDEQRALHADSAGWLRANRARAIDILDRLPSWDHGRSLSHIEFNPIRADA